MIIKELNEQIKKKQQEINSLKKLKGMLNEPSGSLDETILRKYLEFKNVANVAKWLNENGYRTKGSKKERKYTSNDVSGVINDEKSNVPDEIKEYARKMYDGNFKRVMKRYG